MLNPTIQYIANIVKSMRNALIIFLLCIVTCVSGQNAANTIRRPKLVVGIMVDQMRQEYLYRFYSKYGNDGFKRMMNDGFMVKNGHYNYVPTITGPGHASVYTGSTPALHGIIGNSWYDKESKKSVNCVEDPAQKAVGVTSDGGDVSPWRLMTTTVTDELKLFSQKRSKVIGMSFKDRGAVLPAGHLADAAYWFDDKTGRFMTSTYYVSQLPGWVETFNNRKLADQYLSQEWKPVYPIEEYTESGPDDSPYERKFAGTDRPTFPYDLKKLRKPGEYGLLFPTPFANDYLTEFAKAALDGEKLGQGAMTDFLCISFSATDGLGHAVGPTSVELEDMYIRLDRNIADLLKTLDQKVGAGNYTVFLTADHGVAYVAQYLKDNHAPGGYVQSSAIKANLVDYLKKYFPDRDIIETTDGGQVFLNQEAFQSDPRTAGVELLIATELITNYLMAQDGVAYVFSENLLRQGHYDEGGVKGMVFRGFHPKRSGDIVTVMEPGYYSSGSVQGTTHGSPYSYDTHVPMLFYGFGIKKGSTVRYHRITDVAPTISALLHITFPSGCTGQPIEELFEN